MCPIYHTRHTFATMMLENNEDILWVNNMLGHTDSIMTLSKYARYIKRDDKKRAMFLKNDSVPNDTETTLNIKRLAKSKCLGSLKSCGSGCWKF